MLSTQYRMHPEIRAFPSAHFYGGLLTDGEGVSRASRGAPFHERSVFGPYGECIPPGFYIFGSGSFYSFFEVRCFASLKAWGPMERGA
jgi:superfamily I DNA and/or RNA helicase